MKARYFLSIIFIGLLSSEAGAVESWLPTSIASKSDYYWTNGDAGQASVSWNGRYVAYQSCDSTTIHGDSNGECEILLKDRETGGVSLVSKAYDGGLSNGDSYQPEVSANGRFVVFSSRASNLIQIGGTSTQDIYLYDRTSDSIELISLATDNIKGNGASFRPSVSDDGNIVAFVSDANNLDILVDDSNYDSDIFVRNRTEGTTKRITLNSDNVEANRESDDPVVSGDGRYIAYSSDAYNLLAQDSDSYDDVYRYDLQTGETLLVSVDSSEFKFSDYSVDPSINRDGSKVAFTSGSRLSAQDADNYDDVYVRDINVGTTTLISLSENNVNTSGHIYSSKAALNIDGTKIVFRAYTDGFTSDSSDDDYYKAYVRDLTAGTTTLISPPFEGGEGMTNNISNVAISEDGKFVTFNTNSKNQLSNVNSNYQMVYGRNFATNTTVLVSEPGGIQANDDVDALALSDNGRYLVIKTDASNLETVNSSYDSFFLYDRYTDTLTPLKFGLRGANLNNSNLSDFDISANGGVIVFASSATNIDSNDTSSTDDVFMYYVSTGQTKRISVGYNGTEANGDSQRPSISANGRFATFQSYASNLVQDGTSGWDVYLYDDQAGFVSLVSVAVGALSSSGESYRPVISADGQYITYISDDEAVIGHSGTSIYDSVFLYQVATQTSSLISFDTTNGYPNNSSDTPTISWNGRYVAYQTSATDIVGNDNDSYNEDIILYDRVTNTNKLVSLDDSGVQIEYALSPNLSADGRYLVFKGTDYYYNDTYYQYVRDLQQGDTVELAPTYRYDSARPDISSDGSVIALTSNVPQLDNVIRSETQAYIFASDADNDGISNSWETQYGLNPEYKWDAAGDLDGDGLSNLDEYLAGTDPTDQDTDGDGLVDGIDSSPLIFDIGDQVDVNANRVPDILMLGNLSNGKQAIMAYDVKTGQQTQAITLPGWITASQLSTVKDMNGNNHNDIAVLGETSDGKRSWVIFDSKTKAILSSLAFPAWFQPSQMAVVPDFNGNNKDEILVLGQTSDGKKVWMMHDSGLRAEMARLIYPGWYQPVSAQVMKDSDGNGKPEIATLGTTTDSRSAWMLHDLHSKALLLADKQAPWLELLELQSIQDMSGNDSEEVLLLVKTSDNKYLFNIDDTDTGLEVESYTYPSWFTPSKLVSQKDQSGNGFSEIVALGQTTDGKKAWLAHDADYHGLVASKVFPAWYQPSSIRVVPDINEDDVEDIVVFGETSDNKNVVMVQNGYTGADLRTIVLPTWFSLIEN